MRAARQRSPAEDRARYAAEGLELLRRARLAFMLAGSPKIAARLAACVSSACGAVRHAKLAPYREERQRQDKARRELAPWAKRAGFPTCHRHPDEVLPCPECDG